MAAFHISFINLVDNITLSKWEIRKCMRGLSSYMHIYQMSSTSSGDEHWRYTEDEQI